MENRADASAESLGEIHVLIVEDSADDAELLVRNLRRYGFRLTWTRVVTEHEYLDELARRPDIVLADYRLPTFDGLRALDLRNERCPEVPLILVSGTLGEDQAVDAMRLGASDYLLKDRLARLGAAVARAIAESRLREQARQAEEERRRLDRRYRALIEEAADAVFVFDSFGGIVYASPAGERLLGGDGGLPGRNIWEFVHPDERAYLSRIYASLLAESALPVEAEIRVLRGDGRWAWIAVVLQNTLDDDAVGGVVANVRDVTDNHDFAQLLEHQALHDALTGLPNRVLLLDRIHHALDRRTRQGDDVAVLFVDVDHFTDLNDSLGHAAGDRLLADLAGRLQSALRPSDSLARFGGDEFVVVVEGVRGAEGPMDVATRLRAATAPPFCIDGSEVFVTLSVGVAVSANDVNAESLLRDADAAAYRAKSLGRDQEVLFDPQLRAEKVSEFEIANRLRIGLDQRELVVHYQPIVELSTGTIVGFEALVRWDHPERGLLAPDAFLPIAERAGLMVEVDRYVFTEAVREVAALPGTPHLAVNLTAPHLTREGLVADVEAACRQGGFDPCRLEVEITESALMANSATVEATLAALRALGVRLVLDDFGTGYSSLAYLTRFAVHALKIDRGFVSGLPASTKDATVVAAVCGLARGLGLDVVAEGVETAAQAGYLRGLHCPYAQGFHFGRPAPVEHWR